MQGYGGFGSLSVSEAGVIWQRMRAGKNLKPRTHEFTTWALKSLTAFFGDLPLVAITAGHLREYQIARKINQMEIEGGVIAPWKKTAGASSINHELNVLQQMLVLAGLWPRIAPWYAPLPVPGWSPREIPNVDQEMHLFRAAAADPRAALAFWVATITSNCTASGSELRYLRIRHLFLRSAAEGERSEVYIPQEGCKNNARPRKLPLNDSARWAFECCYRRALHLGSTGPDHFLFPFRTKRNEFDPTRPASRSWIRKGWERLREVTGMPRLCPHDLRHLCITRLLEAGISPEIVQSISGHKTQRMMDYYSHVRMAPRAAAVDLIDQVAQGGRKPVISVRPEPHLHERRGMARVENISGRVFSGPR
jgi:integrase